MKKFICILLSTLLILPLIASFGITTAAQSQEEYYVDLFAQREAYMWENYQEEIESGWWGEYHTDWSCVDDMFDHPWVVLLYTDAANQFTLTKYKDLMYSGGFLFDGYSEELKGNFYIGSDILKDVPLKGSTLRSLVQYYNISKQELMNAYREMKENPDAIRPVLSFLTDAEFESGRNADGYFGTWDIPEFVIEALYIEDDVIAENLLCHPFAVYVDDYYHKATRHRSIMTDAVLFDLSGQIIWCDDEEFEEFLKYDLTSIGMKNFIEYLIGIDMKDDFNCSRLQRLIAAREAQLAAAETGDGAVQGVIVLALAIPALAATLILRRKKRI